MTVFSRVRTSRPQKRSRRGLTWFVGLVAGALLPFAPLTVTMPAAHADAPVFDGKEVKDLCTISTQGQTCPAFPAPPELLNSAAVDAAGADIAASLRRLEAQAVQNTLHDHQLPSSDSDAVLSWGRDDAEAELWALIVGAINTPVGQRTHDQQNAVTWMAGLASAQTAGSAEQAGAEYATWAGLDTSDYWQMASTATTAQLTTFLSSDVRTVGPQSTPRSGYCQYRPPAPYTTEYDGSTAPTCSAPCPSMTGCPVPTPTYDQFVKWGDAAATYPTVTDPQFAQEAANIAAGEGYGAAVVGAGLASLAGLAGVLSSALEGSVLSSVIWGAEADVFFAAGAAGAGVLSAAAVVILAIVTAVLEGIRVSDNAQLPGKIAELVASSRTTATDPASLMGTSDGSLELYDLFVGTTMPRPRNDVACDNSLIPPWAYTSSFDPNLLVYVPLGSNTAITSPTDRSGCLNPPEIPVAAQDDPTFLVAGPSGSPQSSPTITVTDPATKAARTVRLSGNWFVTQTGVQGAEDVNQSLRLTYTDWQGNANTAWLVKPPNGQYTFMGFKSQDPTTSFDPTACAKQRACWANNNLKYLGPDGKQYTAQVQGYAAPVGQPSYSPSAPLEGASVQFTAGHFMPGNSVGHVTYSWRFQDLGCGWLQCLASGQVDAHGQAVPAYSAPVAGETVTHTWQSIGPAKVELTVTDSAGHQAQTVFVVNVGDVAPTVRVSQPAWTAPVGNDVPVGATLADAGDSDDENVVVSFGDGQQESVKAGPNSFNLVSDHLPTVTSTGPSSWSVVADHAYAQPGIYYGTVTVSDWGGGTSSSTFAVTVTGSQQVTFPDVGDHTYGQSVTMGATGTASGSAVSYTAGPAAVCTLATDDGDTVKLVGVGQCAVTAHQAADPPVFAAAPAVTRTFSVTPASLTIRPADLVIPSKQVPHALSYSWTGDGWVNGDTDASLTAPPHTGPSCQATVGGHPVAVGTRPGVYPGAVSCTGASHADYDIAYATADLRVDPVVSLLERGLPKGVSLQATLDGQPVTLPVVARQVGLGTSHSYAFAQVVLGSGGSTFVTSAPSFQGPVSQDVTADATYATVPQAVRRDSAAGLVTSSEETRLLRSWAHVKASVKAKNLPAEQTALHAFADEVRGRTTGTALAELMTYAQAVYAYVGGAGSV
jgi:hypothetical protein